jgi:SAM-dependent methyltransferase
MLVKIILLSLVLGGVLWLLLWYFAQIFLLIFSKQEKAVYVGSFARDLRLMREHLHLAGGKRLLDLGCGDGKALRFFAREYGMTGSGYDINSFAIVYGRLINFLRGYRINLYHADFFQADLAHVDYIYLYLFPGQMESIEDWVFSHISKETIVIANTFQFKKHFPFEVIKDYKGKERIRLYRKG